MSVANILKVDVVAALVAADRVEVRSAICTHLPWLDRNSTVWPSVRAALEAPFSEALGLLESGGNEVLEHAIATAKGSLQELLEREFRIVVELKLSVRFEEHAPGVGEAILARLSEAPRQKILESLTDGDVAWSPFDSVVEEQSGQLTRKDLTLAAEPAVLTPGSRSSLLLKTRRGFLLRGLKVKADECSAEVSESRAIPEGTVEVSLPDISVADYPILSRVRGRVALECFVGSNERAVHAVDLNLRLPKIERAPIALFIDMGSTMTKHLIVQLSTTPMPDTPPPDGWSKQLQRDLREASSDQERSAKIASLEIPQATVDFVTANGLPQFAKEDLDKLRPEQLVAWFESAIRGLAGSFARREERLLSHVFWSFPNTHGRDFSLLNEQINQRAGHAVLDRIVIVPEHDCLRLRFGGILHFLASQAQSQHRENSEAQEHNEQVELKRASAKAAHRKKKKEYDEKWWGIRWMSSAPEQPDTKHYKKREVPTLEEWHENFRHVDADRALDEVLILDAGGYSLDVFARLGSRPPFARSFRAGGTRLTDGVRRFLAEERRVPIEDVPWSEAEERKCRICAFSAPEEHRPAFRRCRELTAEIYDKELNKIAQWVSEGGISRGIPVILTGGAMANRFLRERIRGTLQDHGIESHATDSVELASLLVGNGGAKGGWNVSLFDAISRAFSGQMPVPWYDVLGGLAQHAARAK